MTYPTHTTLLTGVLPASHGVISNTLFDPMNKSNGSWYYFADEISVPALWNLTRANKLTSAAISWPVSVGAPVDYLIPEYRPVNSEHDARLLRLISTPGLTALIEKKHGSITVPLDDAWRTKAAIEIFRRYKPSLTLLHLEEPDHVQHVYGPDTKESRANLTMIDKYIGELKQEVETAVGRENVSWMIVSDHGFQTIDRQFNPIVFLRQEGMVEFDKSRVKSWRVYPRITGGSFALVAKDPADKALTSQVHRRLLELKDDKSNGIYKVYGPKELNSLGTFPDAFVAVEMGPGATTGSNIDGPLVSPSTYKGMHGYGLDNPESQISLVLSGAKIRSCTASLEGARAVDIAPTAANLLGLTLSNIKGRVLNEAFLPH